MNENDALDATIPILTEIIEPEQDFAGAALPPAPPSPVDPSATEAADPAEVPPATALSDGQWQALEHQISERVLRQLQTRIDFVLADALQLALEGIAANIKRGLHQTLEDVIARAAAQEIAKLQTNETKPAEDPAED